MCLCVCVLSGKQINIWLLPVQEICSSNVSFFFSFSFSFLLFIKKNFSLSFTLFSLITAGTLFTAWPFLFCLLCVCPFFFFFLLVFYFLFFIFSCFFFFSVLLLSLSVYALCTLYTHIHVPEKHIYVV